MYKLITSDLDETLLEDNGTLSQDNIEAIRAAVAKGVYFVPNSGRSYLSFQDNLQDLGLAGRADAYSISYNGALTLENKNNQIIAENGLDFQTGQQIFDVVRPSGGAVHIYTTDQLYIYHPNKGDSDYLHERGVQFKEFQAAEFNLFKTKSIMKIIIALPTIEERQALKQKVVKQLQVPLAITFSSGRYVEFNKYGANKGKAILDLAKKLGIKPDEIVAVGDNSNDLPMIQAAGLGICVANGIALVKQQAQYVTHHDNNHSALKEVIEKFIL